MLAHPAHSLKRSPLGPLQRFGDGSRAAEPPGSFCIQAPSGKLAFNLSGIVLGADAPAHSLAELGIVLGCWRILRIPSNACRWGPCKDLAMEAGRQSRPVLFAFRRHLESWLSEWRLYAKSRLSPASIACLCGEGGIRTPGTSPFNSFQDCRNRPLYHLSLPVYPTGLQI